MSLQTYAARRRADAPVKQAQLPVRQGPSMDALRSGAAAPTREMLGSRVDLPGAIRAKMENSFGADLSGVQLYESQAVADAGAEAVAQGNKIGFAPGKLDLVSQSGQALLGHELSHVVSQARGEVSGSGFLNDHALEARADREGAMAAAGEQVYSGPVTGSLSTVSAAPAAGPMQAKKKAAQENDVHNVREVASRGPTQASQDTVDAMNFWSQELNRDPANEAAQAALQQAGERQVHEIEQAAAGKRSGGGKFMETVGKALGPLGDATDVVNAFIGEDLNPFSMVQDAMDTYDHGSNAMTQWQQGSHSQAGAEALDAIASGASAVSDCVPKGGFISGGADIIAGGWKLGTGTYHRTKLGKRSRAAKKAGSADYNVIEQLHRATYRDQVDGGMQMVKGGVKVGNEILDPSGVVANLASKGIDMALDKGHEMAVDTTQKKMRRDFLNREYDLDNKIAALQSQNPQMSEKDAKHEALRQIGANSGRRREAFARGVANHAFSLKKRADQNDTDAVGMLSDAGVSATKNGTYSMQAISEAMGMERGVDWSEQVRDAATKPKRRR